MTGYVDVNYDKFKDIISPCSAGVFFENSKAVSGLYKRGSVVTASAVINMPTETVSKHCLTHLRLIALSFP